ncbi:hypothetical protein BLA29_013761, partial [Euroglyphus maynei]
MIELKPTDEIIEEKTEEEICPEIEETKMDVETVKKTVKKSKRKEWVTKLEDEKEKDITEETEVKITEEIIELPGEEQRIDEKPKEDIPEESKPKKPSKKVIRRKSKPEISEEKSEEPKSVVTEELIELK